MAEASGQNARAHAVGADLSSLDGVRALFDGVDEVLNGRQLDILVCNAGIIHHGGIVEVDEKAFDEIFDLNVKGLFFTIEQALSRLRDGGRIINLGTGLTRIIMLEFVTYAAAKSAVTTRTTVLAKQLGARKITVNTVAPGTIDTDMNPWLTSPEGIEQMSGITAVGRVGHAEDIADVVAFSHPTTAGGLPDNASRPAADRSCRLPVTGGRDVAVCQLMAHRDHRNSLRSGQLRWSEAAPSLQGG